MSNSPTNEDVVVTPSGINLANARTNETAEDILAKGKAKREQREVIQPIAKGTRKKKSLGKRLFDSFIGDSLPDIKEYVVQDVIVPTIKGAIADAITGGIDMLFWGSTAKRSGRYGNRQRGTYTAYNSFYDGGRTTRDSRDRDRNDRRRSYDVDDIIFNSRGEAEDVLSQLCDLVETYGSARVSDLYDMSNITGEFTDNYWGWKNLSTASVKRIREGYILDLPRTVEVR